MYMSSDSDVESFNQYFGKNALGRHSLLSVLVQ